MFVENYFRRKVFGDAVKEVRTAAGTVEVVEQEIWESDGSLTASRKTNSNSKQQWTNWTIGGRIGRGGDDVGRGGGTTLDEWGLGTA